jgi:hypothetical protein
LLISSRAVVLIASLLTLVAGWTFARWLRVRRLPAIVFATSAATIAAFIVHVGLPPLLTTRGPVVRILQPHSPATATEMSIQVRGSVTPSDADVIVAVRSQQAQDWYLNKVSALSPGGGWIVTVNLGEATNGIDEDFNLLALARSKDKTSAAEDKLIATPERSRVVALPEWERSNPVIVRRERPKVR